MEKTTLYESGDKGKSSDLGSRCSVDWDMVGHHQDWLSGRWVPGVGYPGLCAQQALSELSQGRAPAGRGNSRKHLVWPVGKSCSSSRGQVSGNHMNSQYHSCLLAGDGGRCSPWIPPQEAGRRPSASEHSPHFLSQPGPPQSPHHLPQIHSCLFSHPLTPPQVHSLPALS